MNFISKLYQSLLNISVGTHKGEDFNPEKVHCYVDGEEVDCFIDRLETEGYQYDSGNEWWQRIWSTNNGKESIKEIYQPLESGNWKQLMIGYGCLLYTSPSPRDS